MPKKLRKRLYVEKGFTLLELLIVITVISILASLLVVVLNAGEYLGASRDSHRVTDLNKVQLAITNALTDNAIELTDTTGCTTCNSLTGTTAIDGTGWVQFNNTSGNGLSGLLFVLPVDPTNEGNHVYRYYSNGTDFEINVNFESEKFTNENAVSDGGNNDSVYEKGWDLTIN
ncbi:MAG: type II secretion system protein [Patescibacteria group bacterium]